MTIKIDVKGDIVSDDMAMFYKFFNLNYVSPRKITDALADADDDDQENEEELEIDIASNGGDVWAASEIYTTLKNYKGAITATVTGLAASAASVILMAADVKKISPTAQIMIHNAWTAVQGNQEDLIEVAQMLSSSDEAIINAYEDATGLSREQLYNLMSKTTFMNAQEAVKLNFADEILFSESKAPVVANAMGPMITNESIDKLKSLMVKNQAPILPPEPEPKNNDLLNAKLQILRGGK